LLTGERFVAELRLLLEGLRAPPDDARFDRDRLLRDAVRERELDEPDRVPERALALEPFALEPARLDAERLAELPLRLDGLRPPAEPLLCPDFEVPSAILASFSLGFAWVRSVVTFVYESVLPTRSTSSPRR